MSPDEILKKYEKRIKALLQSLKKVLIQAGFKRVDGPTDSSSDVYQWDLDVHIGGSNKEASINIRFAIMESEYWDGQKGGVNFGLEISEWGGTIIGGLTPYNYTEKCWVSRSNVSAIETRFKLLEDTDLWRMVDLLQARIEETREPKMTQMPGREPMTYPITLNRYAERTGKTVHWGNIVGPYLGQEFEEVFRTEEQAKERQRQALACEAIGRDRKPIPVKYRQLGRSGNGQWVWPTRKK